MEPLEDDFDLKFELVGVEAGLHRAIQDLSAVRIGMFWVWSSYRPGVNTSASWPSLTITATWLSRTVSCAPIMISLPPQS